jgi:hypothetical protein
MPDDLLQAVRAAAKAEGLDPSKITRELLEAYAEASGTWKRRERQPLRRLEKVSA